MKSKSPRKKYTLDEKYALAKEMRQNPTPAEARMWDYLGGWKLAYKFQRQVVLRGFIVDFFCPKARLIVEVDGSVHQLEDQAVQDELREFFLEQKGYTMLRFDNEDIFEAPGVVLEKIRRETSRKLVGLKAFGGRSRSALVESTRDASSSRLQDYSSANPPKPAPLMAAPEREKMYITRADAEKIVEKLTAFSRRKSMSREIGSADRPNVEKVFDQRFRLEEWLKKKA